MYRILIVEDEEGIAQAVKEQAELWGLEAECVRDFRNVMTVFAEYAPHLVLMDIGLPFLMGITGAARYARFPAYRSCLSPPHRTA